MSSTDFYVTRICCLWLLIPPFGIIVHYAGGSQAADRDILAGQVSNELPDKGRYPGPLF